jgi:hypothetical protein
MEIVRKKRSEKRKTKQNGNEAAIAAKNEAQQRGKDEVQKRKQHAVAERNRMKRSDVSKTRTNGRATREERAIRVEERRMMAGQRASKRLNNNELFFCVAI